MSVALGVLKMFVHYVSKKKPRCLFCEAGIPKFVRAAGNCICKECGKKYSEHPEDPKSPYLNVLCDGTRVKL